MNASVPRDSGSLLNHTASVSGRRWALGFGLVVMLATTLPYYLAFNAQADAWRFTGFLIAIEDGNSYIAKMLSGSVGAWLFRSPYTPAPQSGVLAYLPYLLLGKLSAGPGLHDQLVVLYHLFRIAAGGMAILATYDFLAYFLTDERMRRYGLALAVLGGGLGWIFVIAGKQSWLGSLPLDFYSPETFGFLGLYGFPHLSAARASLLWGLLGYLRATHPRSVNPDGTLRGSYPSGEAYGIKQVVTTGGWWLLAALFQPLTALVMGAVIGVHVLALLFMRAWSLTRAAVIGKNSWLRALRFAVLSVLIPAPFLLYYTLKFSTDPYLKAWTAQNLILSPHIAHYLLAYGLMLPFAVIGARFLLQRDRYAALLPIAWVFAAPLLAYAPVNLQRRLVDGVWVAIIVLAGNALAMTVQAGNTLAGTASAVSAQRSNSAQQLRWRSFITITIFAFPSAIILLAGGIAAGLSPRQPYQRPAWEAAAFETLSSYAQPGEVVLTSYATANVLPAWSPQRVIVGHGPESADFAGMLQRVDRFYQSDTSDTERLNLLDEFDVAYVFYGPEEEAIGSWDPAGSEYLKELFTLREYTVYRVVRSPQDLVLDDPAP